MCGIKIPFSDGPRNSTDDNRAAALACLWRWAITAARSGIRRGVTVDRIRLSLWAHVWAMGWALGLSPLDRRMVAGDVLAQLRAEVSA